MNGKFVIGMAALLVLTMSSACSQGSAAAHAPTATVTKKERPLVNQTVSGSYIAQALGEGEQAIRRVFAEYEITEVRSLGNNQYELRLNRDPGLNVLSERVKNSDGLIKAIQPNFTYRISN